MMRIEHFHPGELMVQRRSGERDRAEVNGRLISGTLTAGAVRFIGRQSMAVLGSRNSAGSVWASVLLGEPGFLSVPDDRTLDLDVSTPRSSKDDPLWSIRSGAPLGVLVIDLSTRGRVRINGHLREAEGERLRLEVERAYPNCPNYVHRRLSWIGPPIHGRPGETRRGELLEGSHEDLIGSADMFFVASGSPDQGLDASHRGGPPGFIRILDARRLRIPDYAGNGMFNTLGNFMSDPRAGIVILDFEGNRTLQLTGRAGILWDARDPLGETGGTHRFWEFEIQEWQETPLPRRMRWELLERSPHIPAPRRTVGDHSTK